MDNALAIVDSTVARGVYHITFTLLDPQNPTVTKVSSETILDSGIPTAEVVGFVYTVLDRPEVLQFSDDPQLTRSLNETGAILSPIALLPDKMDPADLWGTIFDKLNDAVSNIEAEHLLAVFPRLDEFMEAAANQGMPDAEELALLRVLYMFGRAEQVRPAAEATLGAEARAWATAMTDQIKLAVFEKVGLWL